MIALDDLRQAVNEPTGTVALPLTLLTLPGANGVGIELTALYSSNVQRVAQTWNLEASTGTLGLGWTLLGEFVFLDTHGAGAAAGFTYYLASGGAVTPLVRIGTDPLSGDPLYAARQYRFWRITHHPADESWTILKEDGVAYRFGGGYTPGGSGYPVSTGNSIQWGVRWGNWIGPSAATAGQANIPLIWNLASVTSSWGDVVSYGWSSFLDDRIRVGGGGLYATRASYLTSIVDPTGRKVALTYVEKLYDSSTPAGKREYQAPHSGATNTPAVYQDRYETRALDSIEARDSDNQILTQLSFDYEVVGSGDLAKRYLRSIRQQTGGTVSPPIVFGYQYTDAAGKASGVLTGVSTPEGARATFTHSTTTAQLALRDLNILKSTLQKPRLWFDDDYAAALWYDATSRFAHVFAYSWDGRWVESDLGDFAVADRYGALQIATSRGFFAILRPAYEAQGSVKPQVLLFHRSDTDTGQWAKASFWLNEFTADEPIELVTGGAYCAILGKHTGKLVRLTWTGQAWRQEATVTLPYQGQSPAYAIAGKHNYLLVAARPYYVSAETAEMTLYYLDELGAWQTGWSGQVPTTGVNADSIDLYAGESFAVLRVENDRWGSNDYRFMAVAWSPALTSLTTTMLIESGEDRVPSIRGGLVGVDTRIFRFDGASWHSIDLNADAYRYPRQTGGRNLSYGFDTVARRIERSIDGDLVAYTFDITEYLPASATFAVDGFSGGTLPSVASEWGFLPESSHTVRFPGNFVILSDQIFYRQPTGMWSSVGTIPDAVATRSAASVQLLWQNYIAYQSGADATVVPLRNGTPLTPIVLAGQQIYAPQTPLTGLNAFVTYVGTLDSPSALRLHAVVADAVSGAIANLAVTNVTLDDGFDRTEVIYAYDQLHATSDFLGSSGLYSQVSTSGRAAGESGQPNGSTVSSYFNGLPSGLAATAFPLDPADPGATNAPSAYGLLTGLRYLSSTRDASGAVVGTVSTYWYANPKPLAAVGVGAYARANRTDTLADSVTTKRRQSYSADSGMLKQSALSNLNGAGEAEQVIEALVYAYEAYANLLAANVLSPVAQITRSSLTAKRSQIITSEATTWKEWGGGRWAPHKNYRAIANTSSFLFTAWSGSGEPPTSTWLKLTEITARASNGQIRVNTDAMATPSSTLFDAAQQRAVARFQNADVTAEEAAYYGFESYEDASSWQLGPSAIIDTSDAHSGAASLRVPAAGSGPAAVALTRRLRPDASARPYVLAFWIKTQRGFGADPGQASISAVVTPVGGGPPGTNWSFTVTDTGGAWTYVASEPISLVLPGGAAPVVTITVTTQKHTTSFNLDDIRWSPADCDFSAAVYGPARTLTAVLGPNAETHRVIYDAARHPVASVGPVENVASLLQRSVTGTPVSPEAPNTIAELTGAGTGGYDGFLGEWSTRWTPTDSAGWLAAGGWLQHTSSGAGSCSSSAWASAANLGVRVQVAGAPTGAAPTGQVGLTLGNVAVAWIASSGTAGGTWTLNGAELPGAPMPFAREWALFMVEGRVLFWADGRLLVDTMAPAATPGQVRLVASAPAAFRDVVVVEEPRISMALCDGAGRGRQLQLVEGANAVAISQMLYDGISRPAIATKSWLRNVMPQAGLFEWDAEAVTNGSPNAAGSVWQTGILTGTLASVSFPADQGVPFSRTVFESSPLGRAVEQGLPGAEFAIGAHASSTAYGSDASANYTVTSTTDPDGTETVETRDRVGRLITSEQRGGSPPASRVTRFALAYNDAGSQTQTFEPNWTSPPDPSADRSGYVRTQQEDFLGRTIMATSSDEGTRRSIYDPLGRLRFALSPAGAGAGTGGLDRIAYYGYDGLGRPTLVGRFDYRWADLPAAVASGGYKPPAPLATRQAFAYYGAGALAMGRLRQVASTPDSAAAPSVFDTFAYDSRGRLASAAVLAPVFDSANHPVTYTYDNTDQPTSVSTPETSAVLYSYNRRGLVRSIGTAQAPALYSAYLYNPDGSIRKEDLGFLGSQGIESTFAYNPPGWLQTIQYVLFSQSLLYNEPGAGYEGARYWSGTIASAMSRELWSGAPAGYAYNLAYDGLGRLLIAQNSLDTDWSLGVSAGIKYDANGNTLALSRGNAALQLTYARATANLATNRAAQATGLAVRTFTYSPAGQVQGDGAYATQIAYDLVRELPLSIQVATAQTHGTIQSLAFDYGWTAQRVTKLINATDGQTVQLYVRGGSGRPIVEKTRGPDERVHNVCHIYGPTGRVALLRDGQLLYTIKDHQASTRVLFNTAGAAVTSFDYMPFGSLIRTSGDASLCAYRYASGEWDSLSGLEADGVGLYNLGARLYDPVTTRFYGPDPISGPLSPYAYCADDPVNLVDPSGEFFILAMFLLGAAAGGLAGYALGLRQGASGSGLAGYTVGGAIFGGAAGAIGGWTGAVLASELSFKLGMPIAGELLGGAIGEGLAGGIQGAGMAWLADDARGVGRAAAIGLAAGFLGGALGAGALASAAPAVRGVGAIAAGGAAGGLATALDGGSLSDVAVGALFGAGTAGVTYAALPMLQSMLFRPFLHGFSPTSAVPAARAQHASLHLSQPALNPPVVPTWNNGPAFAAARRQITDFYVSMLENPIRASCNVELQPTYRGYRVHPEIVYWIQDGARNVVATVPMRPTAGLPSGQLKTSVIADARQARGWRLVRPLPIIWAEDVTD